MPAVIARFARDQNWAKAAPLLAVATAVWLFSIAGPSDPLFWALVNIPLYLAHQTEEHLWPGGFKRYVNEHVNRDPPGVETLTDAKVFWINILLVWVAFAVFGGLALVDLGFGLVIILFSAINCVTHVRQAFIDGRWNPGLVMASIQLAISIYAAWFLTVHGIDHPAIWWAGGLVFSVAVHAVLFRAVMARPGGVRAGA